MKRFITLSVLVGTVLAMSIGGVAYAATFSGGETTSLPSSQSIDDDAYAAGGTVNVGATINGDLYSAGGQVTISGDVRDDAVLAGGTINLDGNVAGDLRAAGGQINLNSRVGEDALVAGGTVMLETNSRIIGEAYIGGGLVDAGGMYSGPVQISGDEVILRGQFDADMVVNSSTKLIIENGAIINGILTYNGPEEAQVIEGAQVNGEIVFTMTDNAGKEDFAQALTPIKRILSFSRLAWMLVTALVLLWVFKSMSNRVGKLAHDSFWKSVGIGALVLIVMPIGAIALAITVIGLPFAVIVGLLYAALLVTSMIYAGVIAGTLLWKFKDRNNEQSQAVVTWKSIIVGVIVLYVLMFIPILGKLLFLLIMLAALGTLARLLWQALRA